MGQPESRETRDRASELKFALPPDVASRIREWARSRLSPDPHAGGPTGDAYRTSTIYYDTEDLAVYHRKGSYGRSKFRVRRYGASDVVFLERKLRTSGIVSKRRTIIGLLDLPKLDDAASERGWGAFWFHQRILTRRLRPVCQVTYRRMARHLMTDYGPIRLTLDDELVALPVTGAAYVAGAGAPLVPGRMILEMKFRVQMPALFRQLAEAFALKPERLSKYRLAVDALGRPEVRPPSPGGATETRAIGA